MAIFELGDDPDTFDRTIAIPHPLCRIPPADSDPRAESLTEASCPVE